MEYAKFIKPHEVSIGDRTFALSQIPAIESQDLYNVVAKSITDNGLIGMTMLPSSVQRAIMSYVAVKAGEEWFPLDTQTRIDSYLTDSKSDMARLTVLMVKENWGFLADGSLLDVLGLPEAEGGSGS
jgi:hypothetical protein